MLIRINWVAGYDAAGANPQTVVIYGTAIDAGNFDVKLTWQSGATGLAPATINGSAWTAEFRAGTHFAPGAIVCGQGVFVEIPDKNFKTDDPLPVRCATKPVCPKIDDIRAADIHVGSCDAQSLREVSVTVGIAPQTEFFDGHVEAVSLITGNLIRTDVTWPAGAGSTTATMRLAAGPYLLQAVIDSPMKCFGPATLFEAPGCDCPVPVFGTPTVTALADGTKSVSGQVDVQVSPNTTVSAKLQIVRDAAPYTDSVAQLDQKNHRTSTFTLSGTANGVPAGTYRLALIITEPVTCSAAVSDPFTVEGTTPPRTVCPTVTLRDPVVDPASGPCVDGKRKVSAHADIGVATGMVDATLELRGGGTPIQLDQRTNQASPFVLEGSAEVAPGDYSVAVVVNKPMGCGGAEKKVSVAACPPTNGGGGGGNGHPTLRIPWCEILLATALLLLIVGGVILSVALCLSVYVAEIVSALVALSIISVGSSDVAAAVIVIVLVIMAIIGLVLMFIGEVLFFLWLFICGSCRANCGMLLNAIWITAFLAAIWFVITGIAAIVSSLANICFIGPLISFINMSFLHLCVLYYAAAVGCIGWAPIIPSWLRLRIPDFMKSICKD